MLRHFAWFRRDTGEWLREWRGDVPALVFAVPPWVTDEQRTRIQNAQLQFVQAHLDLFDGEDVSGAAWDECEPGAAVCLDVTRFGWPLGDHVWHRWVEADRLLDWGPEHTFIEIDRATGLIVSNNRSHRPIRSTARILVVDITGTELAEHYGHIWGRITGRSLLLEQATSELDLVGEYVLEQEPVYAPCAN